MNKSEANKVAEVITYDQLITMFDNAKIGISDWSVVSNVNKCISRGAAWNILYPSLSPEIINYTLVVRHMIREFGEYIPEELKPVKEKFVKSFVNVIHQEPKF